MANEWMTRFLGVHPGSNPNTVGYTAYNDMLRAGYSNQQIQAGIQGRGLHVGQKAQAPLSSGAQPNWMNQYTGSEGNIGLSTYNRMKDAGYSVLDIQRDQSASGMSFGSAARDQFNSDLRNYFQPQVEENVVADIPLQDWPTPMEDHLAQPWDCLSHHHSVVTMDRVSSSPWLCKIGGDFYTGKYLFTVDYTENSIADDSAQHKQSHVLYLTDAGEYTGNFVALPNNRVRATNPALWRVGEGAPDFMPSQWIHSAEQHESYMDPNITFNNLYAPEED